MLLIYLGVQNYFHRFKVNFKNNCENNSNRGFIKREGKLRHNLA